MSDLRDLYQEVILDHSRRPRNVGTLERARTAAGDNPLCGDQLVLYVDVADGAVRDIRFEGSGCAISTASASLMTEAVRGLSLDGAHELFAKFHTAITSPTDTELDTDALGKLAVLTGVRQYPMRVKCASLAWHTLEAALSGADEPVSTE